MKKRSTILLLVLIVALLSVCLVACNDNQNHDNTPTTVSVTFEYGDGTASTEHVPYGGTVQKPQNPTKENHVFVGWYLAGEEFDFSTAITSDIRLAAKWEALPATLTVTFKSEGSDDNPVVVNRGDKVARPTKPTREGYFFDGWYIGNDKYDFSKPVTEDITVTVKWLTREQINETISVALSKDYSNYTSVHKMEEYYEGETYSYTKTYKRTDSVASFVQVQEGMSNLETIIPFDSNGNPIIVYYLDTLNNEWKKSQSYGFGEYLLPLNMDAIEPDYFEYDEGRYFVLDDCATVVEYALFGTTNNFYGLYIEINDGRIVKIGGGFDTDCLFTQTLEEFGTTQITLPELPALNIEVTAKNEQRTECIEIELSKILALFTITADGRTIEVTQNMLNLGTLNLKNPAVGEYPITCTYSVRNGESYQKTATLTVLPAVESDLTLEEIFARDYSNMTIKCNGTDYLMNYGFMIYWAASTNHFYGVFEDGNFRLVRYNANVQTLATVNWQRMPRMDLFLALNPNLFVQDEEDESVYVLDSSMDLDKDTLALLSAIFKQNEATANGSAIIDEDHGFFIKLTVNDNYIAQIEMTYYAKASANAPATEKTCTYEISNIGTTEEIEPSEKILELLYPQN